VRDTGHLVILVMVMVADSTFVRQWFYRPLQLDAV